MSNKSQLYELIKSLNRSEKGYFKKVYSQNVLGKKNQYIELFDAIDAQEVYDGDALMKQFNDKKIFEQLSVAKNYLYKIILKSLRSYYSQSSIDIELNEVLVNIEILYNKRLIEACKKEIQKAEELIEKYEIPQKFSEIARWQKLLMNQRSNSTDLGPSRRELYEKEKMYTEMLDNLTEYSYLSFQLYSTYTKMGMARHTDMLQLSDQIVSHPLLQDDSLAKSTRAKSFFYNIRAKYSEIRNDFESTHKYNKLFVELLENKPGYTKYNLLGYVPGLYNLILSSVRLRQRDDVLYALEKLKAVPKNFEVPKEYELTIKLMALNGELFFHLNFGQFEEAVQAAKEAIGVLNEDTGKQVPQLYIEIYYFIAYAYFGNGMNDKALVWLNRIINNGSYFPREDMLCYARILNLLCHYELGNERFVEYNLKSTYRFLSKMKKVYKFETVILSFIKLQLKTSSRVLVKERLLTLRKELIAISQDPFEHNAFEHFDFVAWIDSKIEGRSFMSIVKEHNKTDAS
ncbi:MAG: hypothetical protein SFW35_06880 [Chitinophagales bacterium]|nr:hypothetical protein [Chitinophagales bacterium]